MTEGGAVPHRTVDAGRGVTWWTDSWALFMKNPGMWLLLGLIVCIALFVLGVIPFIGGLIGAVMMEVVVGSWVLSARKLEAGGTLEVGDLLSGTKDKLNPLLALGALVAVGALVISVVVMVLGGGAMMGMAGGAAMRSAGGMMAGATFGLLAMLVGLGLGFALGMATWFAAPLVVFRGMAPMDSLKASWAASLANVVPFLVYGVIWIIAAVIASIPFMLGWLVLMPLTMLGIYCSYKDIFEGQQAPATSPGIAS